MTGLIVSARFSPPTIVVAASKRAQTRIGNAWSPISATRARAAPWPPT
jgi:hypothetical protein